jgi:hypothetical protein
MTEEKHTMREWQEILRSERRAYRKQKKVFTIAEYWYRQYRTVGALLAVFMMTTVLFSYVALYFAHQCVKENIVFYNGTVVNYTFMNWTYLPINNTNPYISSITLYNEVGVCK